MKLPLKIEPHSHGYVQLYDADNVWIASCKTEHAESIKSALEVIDAIGAMATNDNCNDQPFR